jgi:chemotaxis protein MotB
MSMKGAEGSAARRPIIKKIRKGGHKHHGGSWKVAYADFVTAMMAFFLLMWLLSSVNGADRAEIASYFKRPMSAILSGGNQQGGDRIVASSAGSQTGGFLAPGADSLTMADEIRSLAMVQEELEEEIEVNPVLSAFADQLRFEMTDEGLRIQITDKQQRPMFAIGSANVQPYTRDVLQEIARILNDVPNPVIVSGHTDATPYSGGESGYSNWELSAERANAARRELVGGGIQEGKLLKVEGLASTVLLNPEAPLDPANRRISILLLNRRTASALQHETGPPALNLFGQGASP